MKLNPECVRAVLLCVEERQRVFVNDENHVEKETLFLEDICNSLPDFDKAEIFYALNNLDQAGYISISTKWANGAVYMCAVNDITYYGHEFLAHIRDTERWGVVKKALASVRDYSLSAISSVAEGVTTAAISAYLANPKQ